MATSKAPRPEDPEYALNLVTSEGHELLPEDGQSITSVSGLSNSCSKSVQHQGNTTNVSDDVGERDEEQTSKDFPRVFTENEDGETVTFTLNMGREVEADAAIQDESNEDDHSSDDDTCWGIVEKQEKVEAISDDTMVLDRMHETDQETLGGNEGEGEVRDEAVDVENQDDLNKTEDREIGMPNSETETKGTIKRRSTRLASPRGPYTGAKKQSKPKSKPIRHKRTQSSANIRYVCRYCRKTYSTPSSLKDHLYLHAGKKRYQCQFCGKTFMHRKERNTHIIVDHDQEQGELKYDSEMQYPSKETVWHCNVCELVFKTLKRLRDHLLEEHPDHKCNRFEASLDSESAGGDFEVVPKTTPRKPPKLRPLSEDAGDTGLSNVNPTMTRSVRSKVKQEQAENNQEQDVLWKCNLCANHSEFLNAADLRKHMIRTHTHDAAKQVSANFGILTMELGNVSISHGKIVDLLETFITLCKKESTHESSTSVNHVDDDVEAGENDDSDENYVCEEENDDSGDDDGDYVTISFKKRGNGRSPKSPKIQPRKGRKYVPKRKYKGTGIRFKCVYCKKTFGHCSTLRDHLYLHSGQKRYKCPHCDMYLMNRGSLYQHVKNIHDMVLKDTEGRQRLRPSEEIIWQCDSCEANFKKLYHIKMHMQDEHERGHCDVFEAKFRMQLKQDMKLLPVKWRDEVLKSEITHADQENDDNKDDKSQEPSGEGGRDYSEDSNTIDVNMESDHEKQEGEDTGSTEPTQDINDEEIDACLSKMYSRKVGFRCRYCQKIYTTVSSVRDHLYLHTDEKRYKCSYCDYSIKARGTLSNHMRQFHADVPPSSYVASQKDRQKPSKEMVWVCTYCAKTYPSVGSVRAHTLEKHRVAKSNVFEVSFSEEFESKVNWCAPRVPRRVAQELAKKKRDSWTYKMPEDCEYICKYGDHISSRVSTLKDHLCSLHAAKPSYQCFYCDEVFKNRSVRSNHCRDVHPKEVKHKKNLGKESWQVQPSQMLVWMCMECNQMFNVVNRLRYHMKESHNSDDCKTFTAGLKECEDLTSGNLTPSFDCKFCGKSFDCPSKVERHETALHKAKLARYRCGICKKLFLTDRSLLTHKNKFHSDWVSEDQPDSSTQQSEESIQHLCKYCGKVFERKCTLTFHERIHSEGHRFHCNQCPRCFLSQHVLSKHQRKVHINPPPKPKKDHLCTYCGKTFTQQKVLDSHVNIHLGIRPFQCKACNHMFPSRRRLTKHIWATKCKQIVGIRKRKGIQHKKDNQGTSESSSKQKMTPTSTVPTVSDRPLGLVDIPSQVGHDRDHRCRDPEDHSLSQAISMANNVIDQSPAVHVDFRQSWTVPEHHQLAGVYMPVTQWRN